VLTSLSLLMKVVNKTTMINQWRMTRFSKMLSLIKCESTNMPITFTVPGAKISGVSSILNFVCIYVKHGDTLISTYILIQSLKTNWMRLRLENALELAHIVLETLNI
jgi:hypothetical protein